MTARRASANVVALLELLREASVTCGRAVSAEARANIEKIDSGGRTGRVLKSLLELQDVPDSARSRVLAAPGTCPPDYAGRAVDDLGARAVLKCHTNDRQRGSLDGQQTFSAVRGHSVWAIFVTKGGDASQDRPEGVGRQRHYLLLCFPVDGPVANAPVPDPLEFHVAADARIE